MNRRKLFMALGGVAGLAVLIRILPRQSLSLEQCLKKLEVLKDKALAHNGAWKPYRVFTHLAQSIEYSMSSYPEAKSPLFQMTVGQLAFTIFSIAGEMKHSLSEPIPAAPAIDEDGDVSAALDKLLHALHDFDAYTGELSPHFAYGKLSKEDYMNAHIMHINQHLTEIRST